MNQCLLCETNFPRPKSAGQKYCSHQCYAEAIKRGVSPEELSDIYLDTLKEQFGDSVEVSDDFKSVSFLDRIYNTNKLWDEDTPLEVFCYTNDVFKLSYRIVHKLWFYYKIFYFIYLYRQLFL